MRTIRDTPLGMVHDTGMIGWPAAVLAILFAALAVGAPAMARGAVMKAAEVVAKDTTLVTKDAPYVAAATGIAYSALPCTAGSPSSTIFADASAAVAGSGAYGAPYNTLAQVEGRLAADASVRTVCLQGTFYEDLNLGDAVSSVLTVRDYGLGATLDAGTSYALYASSLWSGALDDLTVSGIAFQGATYATLNIGHISRVTLSDLQIDSVGASYGVMGDRVDELIADGLVMHGPSYAGFSVRDSGALTITDCALSDVGNYAVNAEVDAVVVSGSTFAGYAYSGLDLDVDSAIVSRNVLYGDIAYHGVVIRDAVSPSVYNNFILDHETAGLVVGECDDTVSVRHNSFRNNGEALRLNGGGDHALQVDVYNNIFYSGHGQQAIEDSGLVPDPDPCDPSVCVATCEVYGYNADVTLDADYNLYLGDVTSINGHEIDFTYWTANSSFDAHSQEADPLFVSSSDLHLTSKSPAIGAGSKAKSVISDIDGDLRGWSVDVGADERGGWFGVKRWR
jgi:hypothetical protein